MKKYSICFIALICFLANGFSKDSEDLSFLKGVKVYNYSFDFRAFKINKIAANDYIDMKLNIPYNKFTSSFQNILITSANENLSECIITNDSISDIEIKLLPTKADQDGEHTIMCKIIHKPSDTLITTFSLNTNGGDDDQFIEELMKGLGKTGKKLAKQLEKLKLTAEKMSKK